METGPIGIFDSGYGGLTILKEIVHKLPQYNYLYLGDNARAPYGIRSFSTVYEYTLECVKWFFSQGSPLVILACNTASAKALRTIQQKDLPVIDPTKRVLGVIRPTSEIIGKFSRSGHIGIMGTPGTIESNSYVIETKKFYPDIKVSQEACPGWVELVESNQYSSPEADFFIKKHIDSLLERDALIDTILLGCTHYPLLLSKILAFVPKAVSVISQGNIIAESFDDYLKRHPEMEQRCDKGNQRIFYTTGEVADFDQHAAVFFGEPVMAKKLLL